MRVTKGTELANTGRSHVGCPADTDVILFANAQLAEPARESFEQHLDGCARCRNLVAELVRKDSRESRDSSNLPAMPGAFGGRYRIEGLIGRGGMGAIYEALDLHLHRRVAVKVVRMAGELSTDHIKVHRMIREARSMAALSHRNVVAVFDVGFHDEQVFIVMELVRGTTLRGWTLAAHRSVRETLRCLRDAGMGLAAAHAAGLVHRDFKPDNVLVSSDGIVRVTDFGLARRTALTAAPTVDVHQPATGIAVGDNAMVTGTGTIMGTPAYMAPEQARGQLCDARADQFSFCMTAWEALFGVRPFAGENWEELVRAVVAGRFEPPPAHAEVPRTVQRALMRGLSADPEARFSSMSELLTELEGASRDRGSTRRWIAAAAGLVALAGAASLFGGVSHEGSAAHASPVVATVRASAPSASAITVSPIADATPPRVETVAPVKPAARPERRHAKNKPGSATSMAGSVGSVTQQPAPAGLREPVSREASADNSSQLGELRDARTELDTRRRGRALLLSDLPGSFWTARDELDAALTARDVAQATSALARARVAIDAVQIDRSFIDQKLMRLNSRIGRLGPDQRGAVTPLLEKLVQASSSDPITANRSINEIAARLGLD